MIHSDNAVSQNWLLRGARQIERLPWLMFVTCLVCMAATLITTWPLWAHRQAPPNLPVVPFLHGVSFGIPLLATLVWAYFAPRSGWIALVGLLLTAIAFDQIRCQPQIFAMPVLMAGCIWRDFRMIARWFLIAMWFWAGLHKLLSPDWMGPASWSLLDRMGWQSALEWYQAFAWSVGIGEIGLACLAIWKPRWAAPMCLILHLGIVAMLILIQWNFSVLFWNVATAVVGCWLLWSWPQELASLEVKPRVWPYKTWQTLLVVFLFLSPAGAYLGIVPHFLAHMLYSDNLPRGMITTRQGPKEIETWQPLHVPMPKEPAILRQYFEAVAQPGEKLHIYDSRPGRKHQHYYMPSAGQAAQPVSSEFFWDPQTGAGQGIARDYPPSVFYLEKAKVRLLKRTEEGMIYAVQFRPQNYSFELLSRLKGLLNLEQIQMAECPLQDDDLRSLSELPVLYGIGLDDTPVTNACLTHLSRIPSLRHIEHAGTQITEPAIRDSMPLFDR